MRKVMQMRNVYKTYQPCDIAAWLQTSRDRSTAMAMSEIKKNTKYFFIRSVITR